MQELRLLRPGTTLPEYITAAVVDSLTHHMVQFATKGFSAADLCEGIAALAAHGARWDGLPDAQQRVILATSERLLPSMSHDEMAAFLWGMSDVHAQWGHLSESVRVRVAGVMQDVRERQGRGEVLEFGDILEEGAQRIDMPGSRRPKQEGDAHEGAAGRQQQQQQQEQWPQHQQQRRQQQAPPRRTDGAPASSRGKRSWAPDAAQRTQGPARGGPLVAPEDLPATPWQQLALGEGFGGGQWGTLPAPLRSAVAAKLAAELPTMNDADVFAVLDVLTALKVRLRLRPRAASGARTGTGAGDSVLTTAVGGDGVPSPMTLLFGRLAAFAGGLRVDRVVRVLDAMRELHVQWPLLPPDLKTALLARLQVCLV